MGARVQTVWDTPFLRFPVFDEVKVVVLLMGC